MLKIPDVTALSDALSLADSHKLVWAAVCLAGGCLLHEVVMTSFLPLVLAGIAVCACLSALVRQLSLCFGLLAGLAGLIASEAEIRRADHLMLADRPAFTLHNLALAAFCLLLVSPSSVYSAGFQLSFVASSAIIAGLEMVGTYSPENRFLRYVFFILLTSALAGLVTVPFIAYHFGQFTLWGILANLIALPLTAFLIMPAGILVLLCEGAGLSGLADLLMGLDVVRAVFYSLCVCAVALCRQLSGAAAG